MFLNQSKKITVAVLACLIAVVSIFTVSCQKELSGDGFTVTETPPDLTAKVNSSVSGFVTNETDAAVNGATVQFGAASTTTDKYGYFEFGSTEVVKNAAVVTVSQPGYFKGIKTYIAATGKSAFIRIKLIPKTNSGSIDAATGGSVTLTNGLSVTLPANAVVVAATSAPYTGQVNVASHWLSPAAADLNLTMPGDLRGLDSLGFLKILSSYGMAAVELTGASGELLQVATGKKATLTFPLSAALLASAPASIPLWYFDETAGLWKQQGNASRSGSTYIGEVSHFSYWNCDIPLSNPVNFSCRVVDGAGNPVPNVSLTIEYANGGGYTGTHAYTDSSGYLIGQIPGNSQLVLNLYSYSGCSSILYTQNITTTTVDVALGNIVLSTGTSVANVSGSVACNGTPITNGFVLMQKDGLNYRYPLSSAGTFSFNTTLCSSSSVVTFIGEDLTALQSGSVTTYTLVPGANVVGELTGCGTSINEFINFTVNTTPYSLTAPTDNLYQQVNLQSNPAQEYISGSIDSGGVVLTAFAGFDHTAIAAGSTQLLSSFTTNQISDSTTILTPINVNITEYGAIGEFIAGNFTGTLTGASPANLTYNITCQFRVRRNQ